MSVERRPERVEPSHAKLSIVRQCRLLSISRSTWYYEPVPESEATLGLMQAIGAVFLDCRWYGSRQMVRHLGRAGHEAGRHRVQRLMAKMGLAAIYQRPRTSDPHLWFSDQVGHAPPDLQTKLAAQHLAGELISAANLSEIPGHFSHRSPRQGGMIIEIKVPRGAEQGQMLSRKGRVPRASEANRPARVRAFAAAGASCARPQPRGLPQVRSCLQ
jgi:hypothetical protein